MSQRKRKRKLRWGRILILFLILCGLIIGGVRLGIYGYDYFFGYKGYYVDKFRMRKQYMKYNDDRYTSVVGIDVSSHQGEIVWDQVAYDENISFVMVRCGFRGATDGNLYMDDYFSYNMSNASYQGLDTGVYFYSTAVSKQEAKEEAEYVLSLIQYYNVTFPVAFDMEIYEHEDGRVNALTKEQTTEIALTFCKAIEKEGYTPMIYGNLDWLENHLDMEQIPYPVWYAAYQKQPAILEGFQMWQYTNQGKISGISTIVDLNVFIKEKDSDQSE